jgi:hypothetical protein
MTKSQIKSEIHVLNDPIFSRRTKYDYGAKRVLNDYYLLIKKFKKRRFRLNWFDSVWII